MKDSVRKETRRQVKTKTTSHQTARRKLPPYGHQTARRKLPPYGHQNCQEGITVRTSNCHEGITTVRTSNRHEGITTVQPPSPCHVHHLKTVCPTIRHNCGIIVWISRRSLLCIVCLLAHSIRHDKFILLVRYHRCIPSIRHLVHHSLLPMHISKFQGLIVVCQFRHVRTYHIAHTVRRILHLVRTKPIVDTVRLEHFFRIVP